MVPCKGLRAEVRISGSIINTMEEDLIKAVTSLLSMVKYLADPYNELPTIVYWLMGTVWGIYHALAAISATGLSTLDKVAGPVGEALIMTAFGLSVAIPAVLAYNTYLRAIHHTTSDLEDYAQELISFMITGIHTPSLSRSPHSEYEAIQAGKG